MLGTVAIAPRTVAEFDPIVGEAAVGALRRRARPLRDLRVLHLTISAFGTWHTDLLNTSVPLLQNLGLHADWGVVHPSHSAEPAVQALYAALAGTEAPWDLDLQRGWQTFTDSSRSLLDAECDVVVVHDPQLLALAPEDKTGTNGRRAAWIWHSHLDLSSANPAAIEALAPYLPRYDAAVFEDRAFVPGGLSLPRVEIISPGLDPLGPRNVPMDAATASMLVSRLGVDPERPLLAQISPLSPGSDALGLIEAYDALQRRFPALQLAVVPTAVRDDERTRAYFDAVSRMAREREGCIVVPVAAEIGNAELNALQQAASVVVQKSLDMGYALWLSEAMWKQRPVVAGRSTGAVAQIVDGETGYLVPDTATCIQRLGELLADPDLRRRLGENGRRHVSRRFLITRYLNDVLGVLSSVVGADIPA